MLSCHMYKKHFGLLRKPFELSPDSNFLFLGETHKEALSGLKQGVVSGECFLLLTGGVGTGKTTLVNVLAKTFENPGYLCLISNPALSTEDFFYYFAAQLGLLFDGNKARFLVLFAKLLEECKKSKRKIFLIIDEAHALPVDLLEELRLFASMAGEFKDSLSVFLVGQPELLDRLTERKLSGLSQRIVVRYHLNDLSSKECRQYIEFRISRAGVKDTILFTEGALDLVCQATGGNPRQINILCDNSLLSAYYQDETEVSAKVIRRCAEVLHIQDEKDTFYLLQSKVWWRKWMVWTVLVILVAEGTGLAYAYQKGWLASVYQYITRFITIG